MDDLISRAAATRAAVISVRDYLGNIDSERDIHIEEGLHEVPAVDAVPVVHAKWKVILNPFWDAECSECGYTKRTGWEWGFCPNFGAKMQNGR